MLIKSLDFIKIFNLQHDVSGLFFISNGYLLETLSQHIDMAWLYFPIFIPLFIRIKTSGKTRLVFVAGRDLCHFLPPGCLTMTVSTETGQSNMTSLVSSLGRD